MSKIYFISDRNIERFVCEYIESISQLFDCRFVNSSEHATNEDDILVYIQLLPENISESQLKRSYLLNTEQLTKQTHLDYILDISKRIPIIDYSYANINILSYHGIKSYYLPYIPNNNEIYNYEKIYHCCTFNGLTCYPRRLAVINANNKITNITDSWGKERDDYLFRHKILVNIHAGDDYKVFEEIRCNRCINNKIIVITEKSQTDLYYPYKNNIIECDYDDIPKMVDEVLNNYEFYHQKLFGNFHINKIKDTYMSLIDVPFKQKIPKIFHHIWVGPKQMPEKFIRFIEKIKELHPDYEFRLWTDKDLITENFLNLEYIHEAKKYAQKADIMRYEILYNHGGIYLDTDFELFKNITPLLTRDLVVCNEDQHHDKYITVAFIASSKGNSNMKRCIDNIPTCLLNGRGGGINFETGPWYLGKNTIRDENVKLLPTHVMYPVHYNQRHDPIPEFSDETYGMHHWDHSWA